MFLSFRLNGLKRAAVISSMIFGSPTFAENVLQNCTSDHLNNKFQFVKVVYSPQNVCNWLSNAVFSAPTDACSGLLSDSPNAVTVGAESSSEEWQVVASPITDSTRDGFIEIEVVVAGRGTELTSTFSNGYEEVTLRLVVFARADCTFAPYLYARRAIGNPRSFDELLQEHSGNTKLFDITNDKWVKLRKPVDEAIRQGMIEVQAKLKYQEN